MSTEPPTRTWVPLTARERRVVGVLVEKGKTTPEYYPLSLAAIVTGCNQKSNREPLTNYDADDVEDVLQALRKKGAAVQVEGGGRVPRFRHTLYEWLPATKVELGVLAELLLRGPQTEGDLRARAARMETLPDLAALQAVLEALVPRDLAVYLSPTGTRRGVTVTHGLYPPEELAKVRQAYARQAAAAAVEDDAPAAAEPRAARESAVPMPSSAPPRPDPGLGAGLEALRAEVEALRGAVAALQGEVRDLKTALGA